MNLPGAALVAQDAQLARELEAILASFAEPARQMRDPWTLDAAARNEAAALERRWGRGLAMSRGSCERHLASDGRDRLAGCSATLDLLMDHLLTRPHIKGGGPLCMAAREGVIAVCVESARG